MRSLVAPDKPTEKTSDQLHSSASSASTAALPADTIGHFSTTQI